MRTAIIPEHDGMDICSAPTCRRTEILAPEAMTVPDCGAVWSVPERDRTRVVLRPFLGEAPVPVEFGSLRLDSRAEIDAYVERVTELTMTLGSSADAVRVADIERGVR